jgi:3-hydroxyisobutyrate dehydrogenase-like beta-hydroxyacid dehydrogenase
MTKDLRLALDLYERAGTDTPITRTTLDLFTRAEVTQAEADIPAVAEVFAPGGTAAR